MFVLKKKLKGSSYDLFLKGLYLVGYFVSLKGVYFMLQKYSVNDNSSNSLLIES